MRFENERLNLVYWYIMQYTVCVVKGHTQDYDDFDWCDRCYKSSVFEVQ
jgi:hypothetical protein